METEDETKFIKRFKPHTAILIPQETVIDRFNSFDHLRFCLRELTFGDRDLLACPLYLVLYIKHFYEMVSACGDISMKVRVYFRLNS